MEPTASAVRGYRAGLSREIMSREDGHRRLTVEHGDMVGLWRRWPSWVGRVAMVGAVATTISGTYWGLGGPVGAPVGGVGVGWFTAASGAVAAAGVAARAGWVCWVGFGLFTAGQFGLVMDLVMLAGVGYVDDWWGFGAKLVRAVTSVALAGAALAFQRRARGVCGRCGFGHADPTARALRFPRPSRASRAVRWTAYAGVAAFLPYIGGKTAWAMGVGLGGWRGPELVAGGGVQGWLARAGLDLTALLGLLAVFLVVALTRPWSQRWPGWVVGLAGRRVPRWLPLVPAFLGASTLAPYGVVGMVAVVAGPVDTDGVPGWLAPVALLGFGGLGVAMAATGWSYLRRTRPRCEPGRAQEADG